MDKKQQTKLETFILNVSKQFIHHPDIPASPGLMSGNAGISLFLYYVAHYFKDQNIYDQAEERLQKVMGLLNSGIRDISFANGIAGMAWTIAHLNKKGYIKGETETRPNQLDHLMHEIAVENINNAHFELLYGYTGTGLYFLENEKTHFSTEIIKLIIDHLSSNIDINSTMPGLAHGLAGPVSFCAKCIDNGYEIDRSKKVLQTIVPEIFNIFSHMPCLSIQQQITSCKHDNSPNPFGWCHGLPGIALSVLQAGRATLRKDWMSCAIHCINDYIAELQQYENELTENCLCHGKTGIANILRKFYFQTKITTFLDASDYWIKKSVADTDGSDALQGKISEQDLGLLMGISGICLSYLNFLTPDIEEPGWDTCLLIS